VIDENPADTLGFELGKKNGNRLRNQLNGSALKGVNSDRRLDASLFKARGETICKAMKKSS